MYQFSFRDRKGDAQAGRLPFKLVEEILEPSDVATIGEGSHCEGEVGHIRDHQTPRDPEVQWRNVEKKEERGDWGALGGSDVDWGWGPWCPLENQGAASFPQKGRNPGDQVGGYPAFPPEAGQSFVVDVVEPRFYIQQQGGDLESESLQGSDVVGQGEACVVGTKPRERTALVGVQQPLEPGCHE